MYVTTPDGEELEVEVPHEVQPGSEFDIGVGDWSSSEEEEI